MKIRQNAVRVFAATALGLTVTAAGKVTNVAEANRYLTREYRKGWELAGA